MSEVREMTVKEMLGLLEWHDQLVRWDKSTVAGVSVRLPGLTKRRAAERAICLEGAAA